MCALAPIVLFSFNRPEHVLETLEALKANILASESDLFVYCDGPRNDEDIQAVAKVRHIIRNISGFKSVTVVESQNNKGLAQSIISGVTEVSETYGKVIVLEDDVITSPYFLQFMNRCLSHYRDSEKVFSIAGWSPPTLLNADTRDAVVFLPRNCSWGWATWKDRWLSVDWGVSSYKQIKESRRERKSFNRGGEDLSKMLDAQMAGRINSWSIRFCYSQHVQGKLTAFPVHSYAENIGCDGSGQHCKISVPQQRIVLEKKQKSLPDIVQENEDALKLFVSFYAPAPFFIRCINKLSRALIGKNIVTHEDIELKHL